MAKLNMQALKDLDKELSKKGEGSKLFVQQKDLTDETLVRFMPASPKLNGVFYFEVIRWWINGRPFISYATFGKRDVVQEEYDEALASEDADLLEILNDVDAKGNPKIKKEVEFWMPTMFLKYTVKKDELVKVDVIDNMVKIFIFTKMLLKDINKNCVLNRMAQNKTEDGLMDRVNGFNCALSKTKTGTGKFKTSYSAQIAEQWEMPSVYYNHVPDVHEVAKNQLSSSKYLRAVIREYLYGEEIPVEVEEAEEQRKEDAKLKYKEIMHSLTIPADISGTKKRAASDDDDEESAAPARRKVLPKTSSDDDDAADTKPVRKKPAATDEDEDELPFEDEAPAKKAPVRTVANTKATKPNSQRRIMDDINASLDS